MNFLDVDTQTNISREFDNLVAISGVDGNLHQKDALTVIQRAGLKLSALQIKRLRQYRILKNNAMIEKADLLKMLNQVFNELDFVITVGELQDLFLECDTDGNGLLEATEIVSILNRLNLTFEDKEVLAHIATVHTDSSRGLNFEEFMILCKRLYSSSGGRVIANKSRQTKFNQTRHSLDDLHEFVDMATVTITHLQAEIKNYEQQMEIQNVIQMHSSFQMEINKCKQEYMSLTNLRDEMELQNKQWILDINRMHEKERAQMLSKVEAMRSSLDLVKTDLESTKELFRNPLDDNLFDESTLNDVLQNIDQFVMNTSTKVIEDTKRTQQHASNAAKILTASNHVTPQSTESFGNATVIDEYLRSGMIGLEEWLAARTNSKQKDRNYQIHRVDEVKTMRMKYEEKKNTLSQQLSSSTAIEVNTDATLKEMKVNNRQLLIRLEDRSRKIDEKKREEKLNVELVQLQEKIGEATKQKFALQMKLHDSEQQLHIERGKISALEVDLGELKLTLDQDNES